MSAQHTPGNWSVAKDEPRKVVSDGIYGMDPLTGENVVGGAVQGPYSEGNARVFAAASDMLAALRMALPVLLTADNKIPRVDERIKAVEAAIAKAEGRA